jgi:uncharacterized protein with HEPN domain
VSRDDRDLLDDILARIHLTTEFVQGDHSRFMQSRLVQEAVIRNLEVIGEAARNISDALCERYPDVPWREIAAFRNFAIHVYWGLKFERVWQIIDEDLPRLKTQVEAILRDLHADG